MENKIIVVDNFYPNPDKIRELALETNFNSVAKYNYPGYQSDKRFVNTAVIKESFEDLVGKKINVNNETFGGFRIMTEESGSVINVHTDAADWAGLVFLSLNPDEEAGLGIFRHKETGFTSPPNDIEARKIGFEDSLEFYEKIIYRDKTKRMCWELVDHISPDYNRLVLIKGRELFHAAIKGFGHRVEESRLTHNFFFNEKNS